MKSAYKKIIAKEILILFGIIAVVLIVILGLYLFNGIQDIRQAEAWNQVEKIDKKIDALREKRKNETTDNLFMNLNQEQNLRKERKNAVFEVKNNNYESVDFELGKKIVSYGVLVYAILIYPIRFLFLAINWSIKELNGNILINNKTSKKIIAKEFLFLAGTTILFFLILFAWSSFNKANHDKQNEIKVEINLYKKNNQSINDELLRVVYGKLITEATYNQFVSDFKQSSELQKLSYNKLETDADFDTFLNDALGKNKAEKPTKLRKLKTELKKTKNSIFNQSISEDEVFGLGMTLFSVFFIFRYMIYGTKWSIRQLKE